MMVEMAQPTKRPVATTFNSARVCCQSYRFFEGGLAAIKHLVALRREPLSVPSAAGVYHNSTTLQQSARASVI